MIAKTNSMLCSYTNSKNISNQERKSKNKHEKQGSLSRLVIDYVTQNDSEFNKRFKRLNN